MSDVNRKPWGGFFARAATAIGGMRDVVVRSSQIGKIKLDTAQLRRDREAALARLGAEAFARAEAGEIVLPPDLDGVREEVRALEDRLAQQEIELAAVEAEAELQREVARAEERAARDAAADMAADKYEREAAERQAAETALDAFVEQPEKKSAG